MDLRYLFAPFIKLLLPSFLVNPRLSHPQSRLYSPYILLLLKLVSSLLIAILTIIFLFFSIKPSLARTAVYLRGRNFSALVALSLLCSVFLSPAHFWMVYPLILCLSPWESLIFKVMKWVFSWLYHTLEAIPDLTIVCNITQQEEDHMHMQVEVEAEVEVEVEAEAEIDGLEGHTDQEQLNLEGACVVLIADDDEVL